MAGLERALRSLVKVGMKVFAPFVGDVISAAGEEGLALYLDHSAARKARNWHDRLLQQLRQEAEGWGKDEAFIEPILATVEQALLTGGLGLSDWSSSNYSPQAATKVVLERSQALRVGLSQEECNAISSLLQRYHESVTAEIAFVRGSEMAFRQETLNQLDALMECFKDLAPERQDHWRSLLAGSFLQVPLLPWDKDRSPPGALLRADIEGGVPFHGRQEELQNLDTWCEGESRLALRVYSGQGGMGKTRLLIEACHRMSRKGWRCGFLDRRAAVMPLDHWQALMQAPQPSLVVIDYAETDREDLPRLLELAYRSKSEHARRIVLLARAADDWWDELKTSIPGAGDLLQGPAAEEIALKPFALDRIAREETYRLASETFSLRLGASVPDGIPHDLTEPYFDRILFIHMAALAHVDGAAEKGDQGILDYILLRERRFWHGLLEARGMPQTLRQSVGQAITVISLWGGVDSWSEARDLFKLLPLLQDQDTATLKALSNALHDAYPGTHWIEPILPDLLAEHLAGVELERDPDLYPILFDH